MLTILTFVNFSAFVTDINSAFGVEITGSGAEVFLLWSQEPPCLHTHA